MKAYLLFYLMLIFIGFQCCFGQISQDCIDAIPICKNTPVNGGTVGIGADDFNTLKMSGCLEATVDGTIESNSAWYRFKTGASGQLGINIGINTAEDWDFALYKTNNCSALGDPIRCNFYDNSSQNNFIGIGEDPTGDIDNIQFEEWLQVAPGEDYYLLINNFSNSNSGFSIQFSGEIFETNPFDALDCSINSNLLGPPISACEFDEVTLDATTDDAIDYTWYSDTGNGFQEVIGEKEATFKVLEPAVYQVRVAHNTGAIFSEVQVAFSTVPTAHPLSNETLCNGMATYDLSLKNSELLGSQNPNNVVVNYYSSLGDAIIAENALEKNYTLQLGSQIIYARVTSALNPDCFDAPQQFELINLESPKLDLPSEAFLCNGELNIEIGPKKIYSNYTYSWNSGDKTPMLKVSQLGTYTLTVTKIEAGSSCSISKDIVVGVVSLPSISDIEIKDFKNNNTVVVITDNEGDWLYQLDGGAPQTSNIFTKIPPGEHTVSVSNFVGCGAVSEKIIIAGFPKFFSPNGDGTNDVWTIEGLADLTNPVITIYDRYGNLLAQLSGSNFGWDGIFHGELMPSSDYWFKLSYIDADGQVTTAKHINNHFSLRK